jgi:hypothetical protein
VKIPWLDEDRPEIGEQPETEPEQSEIEPELPSIEAGSGADPGFASIDADAFYLEGPDIHDTKAPGGPIEDRWTSADSKPSWSTQPTGASSR